MFLSFVFVNLDKISPENANWGTFLNSSKIFQCFAPFFFLKPLPSSHLNPPLLEDRPRGGGFSGPPKGQFFSFWHFVQKILGIFGNICPPKMQNGTFCQFLGIFFSPLCARLTFGLSSVPLHRGGVRPPPSPDQRTRGGSDPLHLLQYRTMAPTL